MSFLQPASNCLQTVKCWWRSDQHVLRNVAQYANFCPVFAQLLKNLIYAFLNSEVTRLMFATFLYDVKELLPLLMRALQGATVFRFGTPEHRVKAVNFEVCKLLTIAKSLGLLQNLCQFNNRHIKAYISQHWKSGDDRSSTCWDIRYKKVQIWPS